MVHVDVDDLRNTLAEYGQEHLLRFWNSLTDSQKERLTSDIDELNVEAVVSDFHKATSNLRTADKIDDVVEPVPKSLFGNLNETPKNVLQNYEDEGLRLICENKVAVLVFAGGQGTRLGVTYPKGMYDVGLPSHKTLFQLQAERILKVQELARERFGKTAGGTVTWFIMTSGSTMDSTMDFFRANKHFGLRAEDVLMFEQCMLPAFTFDGRIILEDRHKIAMSPDGNGGLYRALRDRKMLNEMEARGIQYVHAFGVDNILLKVGDPVFVGYCAARHADCGVKVIEKIVADEPVGVVCTVNGRWQVVEYSEISPEIAEKRADDGRLTFRAGNICNHLFATRFLRDVAERHVSELRPHVAQKKIPFVDEDGATTVRPTVPNGVKMEKFVFDAFPFAQKLVVWEVNRDEEFSALKNPDEVGKDCPTTARKHLFRLHRMWVEKAGGRFDDGGPDADVVCEISPRLSYAGEGLEELVNGKTFSTPLLLKSGDE